MAQSGGRGGARTGRVGAERRRSVRRWLRARGARGRAHAEHRLLRLRGVHDRQRRAAGVRRAGADWVRRDAGARRGRRLPLHPPGVPGAGERRRRERRRCHHRGNAEPVRVRRFAGLAVSRAAFAAARGAVRVSAAPATCASCTRKTPSSKRGWSTTPAAALKWWFGQGGRRFGVRGEAGISIRDGGFDFKDGQRVVPGRWRFADLYLLANGDAGLAPLDGPPGNAR